MKVNDTPKNQGPAVSNTPAQAPRTETRADAGRTTATAHTAQASSDSVRLSAQGQALASAVGGSNAVFDTKKVERIKLAIAGGQYQVNTEKVADGLLETVRDLLHSRKR